MLNIVGQARKERSQTQATMLKKTLMKKVGFDCGDPTNYVLGDLEVQESRPTEWRVGAGGRYTAGCGGQSGGFQIQMNLQIQMPLTLPLLWPDIAV